MTPPHDGSDPSADVHMADASVQGSGRRDSRRTRSPVQPRDDSNGASSPRSSLEEDATPIRPTDPLLPVTEPDLMETDPQEPDTTDTSSVKMKAMEANRMEIDVMETNATETEVMERNGTKELEVMERNGTMELEVMERNGTKEFEVMERNAMEADATAFSEEYGFVDEDTDDFPVRSTSKYQGAERPDVPQDFKESLDPIAAEILADDSSDEDGGTNVPRVATNPVSRHILEDLIENIFLPTGCGRETHAQAHACFSSTASTASPLSLGALADVLALQTSLSTSISAGQSARSKLIPEDFDRVFFGHSVQGIEFPNPTHAPPHVCLESDHIDQPPPEGLVMTLDVDSFCGTPSSLAVARHGIRHQPCPLQNQNISSSIHYHAKVPVWVESRRSIQTTTLPIHLIPHIYFGRFQQWDEVDIYVLFPGMKDDLVGTFPTDKALGQWYEEIFLPSYEAVVGLSPSHTAYPHRWKGVKYNSTISKEQRRVRSAQAPYRNKFNLSIHADVLEPLWANIQTCISVTQPQVRPSPFYGAQLFINGKNFKHSTENVDLLKGANLFNATMNKAINWTWLELEDHHLDVALAITAKPGQHRGEKKNPVHYSLFSRQCCNRMDSSGFERFFQQERTSPTHQTELSFPPGEVIDTPSNEEEEEDEDEDEETSGPTHFSMRDTHDSFNSQSYSIGTLRDIANVTVTPKHRTGTTHLMTYFQRYSTVHNALSSQKMLPFENEMFEDFLMPDVAQSLIDKRIDPTVILQAWEHCKQRTEEATRVATKSYPLRAEARLVGTAFQALLSHLEDPAAIAAVNTQLERSAGHYVAIPTADVMCFLRNSINRSVTAIESMRDAQDLSLEGRTRQRARVGIMLAQFLKHSIGGWYIPKSIDFWIDSRGKKARDNREDLPALEGMGFSSTVARYGFGWMRPKFSTSEWTFQNPHSAKMRFNTSTYLRGPGRYVAAAREALGVEDSVGLIYRLASQVKEEGLSEQRYKRVEAMLISHLAYLVLEQFRIAVWKSMEGRFIAPDAVESAIREGVALSWYTLSSRWKPDVDPPHMMTGVGNRDKKQRTPGQLFLKMFDENDKTRGKWKADRWSRPWKAFRNLYRSINHELGEHGLGHLGAGEAVNRFKAVTFKIWLHTVWAFPAVEENTVVVMASKTQSGRRSQRSIVAFGNRELRVELLGSAWNDGAAPSAHLLEKARDFTAPGTFSVAETQSARLSGTPFTYEACQVKTDFEDLQLGIERACTEERNGHAGPRGGALGDRPLGGTVLMSRV